MSRAKSQRRKDVSRERSSEWARSRSSVIKPRMAAWSTLGYSSGQSSSLPSPHRETDRRLNLLPRMAACFEDHRNPLLISHTVKEMVAQRVYGLALGYEDLSDHDQLREDPLLAVLSGKARAGEEP